MTKGQALDAVYFLMLPGWDRELRSNRWHYASRWACHVPVTLVQAVPSLGVWSSYAVAEPRIENCRILYVRATGWGSRSVGNGLIQAEQIRQDVSNMGFCRVMFWLYDPSYFLTWGILPAAFRVVHATENYFMFPIGPFLSSSEKTVTLRRWIYCMQHADATICCSDGVAASCRPHARGHIETITNGCDRDFYDGATPDASVVALRGKLERTAVFAGNIDERIDYVTLAKAAERNPRVLFLLVGPKNVHGVDARRAFKRVICRSNVRYLDAVPAERLPEIYAACDVGMLPYGRNALVYENGFPLKTFEMVAAGLPIVVQNLKMIEPFAGEGIVYVRDGDSFSAEIGVTSRAALSASARKRLAALAWMQDYGAKFETARELVERIARSAAPAAPMRELFDAGPISFREAVSVPGLKPSTDPVRRIVRRVAWSLPHRIRRWGKKRAPDWLLRFIES